MKNKKVIRSFYHAANGLINALKEERNLRFHIVIANLICIFAAFYGLDRLGWAILVFIRAFQYRHRKNGRYCDKRNFALGKGGKGFVGGGGVNICRRRFGGRVLPVWQRRQDYICT